jgi:RNA polymerase sigma-70 factor (ECF subfamily)
VTPTDTDLVALARGGSQAAYREIVCRYERPVFNLIVRMVRDRTTAEDLSQDTFLKAFSRLDRYDPRYKLSNWLLKIAHNTVIDHLRKHRHPTVSLDAPSTDDRKGPERLIDPAAADPIAALENADLVRALEGALARLRPAYRQAVILRYHEDLSHEDIAEIMGIPVGTVKSYLHRARADLAELLGNVDTADEAGHRGGVLQPGRPQPRRREQKVT